MGYKSRKFNNVAFVTQCQKLHLDNDILERTPTLADLPSMRMSEEEIAKWKELVKVKIK